ncbi:MAG: acyl-ACP--UDP-N-acetylglucosamine O-acyltransferase [Planctomycetota bacterium]|nr:acyl-ACP--UDP-N-acetylglucosamine O-acyltransferase [Planctomycetota bacterium]
MSIHPSAIISSRAELGLGVEVGPYAIIEDGVKVGDGCRIRARAHLCPGTTLGKDCDIHMNAVIGHVPQDLSHKGEPVFTVLGNSVVVRENATIHGTVGPTATIVGDKCYLMVGSHVAHNCRVGQNVLLANGALLAGHVCVEDGAFVSGNVVIHQFVRVGRLAILSGGSRFGMDVPPYLIGDGVNAITTLNMVGLRRAQSLSDEDRREIKGAYKVLYRSGLELKEALERLRTEFKSPAVAHWVEFFSTPSRRGFCRHRVGVRRATFSGADSD